MNWLCIRDRFNAAAIRRNPCPALLLGRLVALMLISILGCNSAHVLRYNVERTAENGGRLQPRPWPSHPFAPATGARQEVTVPHGQHDELREDPDAEIIQTAAQWSSAPRGGQVSNGAGVISGRVVDSSGRPVPFVLIVAAPTRRPGGNRAQGMTDRQGNFAVRGLEPGQRYLILATATRSTSSLIGRTSATSPQQGVTIRVSPPFTADRRLEPRSDFADARAPSDPPAPVNGNSAPQRVQRANPFAQTAETNASAQRLVPRPQPEAELYGRTRPVPTPSAPKLTREQAAEMNRLPSPWDMPAPSTRKTAPSSTVTAQNRSADSAKTDSSTGWRQAGANRNGGQTSSGTFSLLDGSPASSRNAAASDVDQSPESRQPESAAGSSQAKRPLEVDANARPDRPRSALTAGTLPTEQAVADPARPHEAQPRLHEGPMCQMDGRRLVDFQLSDVDGHPVCFSAMNSRLVLLDFWTTWCGPCLKAMPHLVSLQKRYGDHGLQVVGIACEQGPGGERAARVAKIRHQLHVSYPLLIDHGDDKLLVRDHFGIDVYPTLILLDKSGKVLWRSEGPDQADLTQLENLLKTQLNPAVNRYN